MALSPALRKFALQAMPSEPLQSSARFVDSWRELLRRRSVAAADDYNRGWHDGALHALDRVAVHLGTGR